MNWDILGAKKEADEYVGGVETSLIVSTPGDKAWDRLDLQVEFLSPCANVYLNLDPWYIEIDAGRGRLYLGKFMTENYFEAWDFASDPQDWQTVRIIIEAASVTLEIAGSRFVHQAVENSPMTSAHIYFNQGARFREPQLNVHEIAEPYPYSHLPLQSKSLEFTVDFYDDMLFAPFNSERLNELFETIAAFGTSQTRWIHHGPRENGLWSDGRVRKNAGPTFDALGDDLLPAAVKASHRAGMPLIGIFKPFDCVMTHCTLPVKAEDADAVGGKITTILSFPAAHPELCLQRRTPPARQGRPDRIVIQSRQDFDAGLAQGIQLFVSRDNASYSRYTGPVKTEVSGRDITLSEFEIDETFIVLLFPPVLASQINNALPHLAKVCDEAGAELEFTYAINRRFAASENFAVDLSSPIQDFRSHGLNFDRAGDAMPSGNSNPQARLLQLFSLSETDGILGLAMASNAQVPGVPSEAEPAVHQWWLSMVESMLDSGVDGVEIRTMPHCNIIDWSQYGFNGPVVAEYKRRYGVDIRTEEFSLPRFRVLRAEFFTEFLRKASKLTRERGRQFHLHFEDTRQGRASEPCAMEIEMPWRTWLDEGLCDGVTLKAINFWAHDTAFGRELLARCREQNLPVNFAPFYDSPFPSNRCQGIMDAWLNSRYDALNVYEFASILRYNPQGVLTSVDEAMTDWLKNYPWKKSDIFHAK